MTIEGCKGGGSLVPAHACEGMHGGVDASLGLFALEERSKLFL